MIIGSQILGVFGLVGVSNRLVMPQLKVSVSTPF